MLSDVFLLNFFYLICVTIFFLGLFIVIFSCNLFCKVMGLAIFQNAVLFFYIASSYISCGSVPIYNTTSEYGASDALSSLDTLYNFENLKLYLGSWGNSNPVLCQEGLYHNPLPQVLMLTAIVVGVVVQAVALAIIVRIKYTKGGG